MKRFHVHLSVENLPNSVAFYSNLFGTAPSVLKDDYAKWMLDDPRVNFAISQRGHAPGLNHLGFQVETDAELESLRTQVRQAEIATLDEPGARCCYARSEKYWVQDPQGIAWETFHTLGDIPVFGTIEADTACCTPQMAAAANACCPPAAEPKTPGAVCCG